MKKNHWNSQMKKTVGGLLAGVSVPGAAFACACGCGVFDVGTSSMFPSGPGGMAYLNYSYQDQNQNWSGRASAPAANNDDQKIETHFITVGMQYLFNRSWGAQLELPIVNRTFDSTANAGAINWTGVGDIRLKCLYTGFSDDLSSGVSLGVKLPTGNFTQTDPLGDIDRDTQIGSGSTDLLFGGFYRHALAGNSHWEWFAQAELDVPVAKQGDYRPGVEVNAAGGIDFRGWNWGRTSITPIIQIIGSVRGHDCGTAAAPEDSGYERILLAPGLEVNLHPVRIYGDVELPVYQNVRGNQLVAPVLLKLGLSFMF